MSMPATVRVILTVPRWRECVRLKQTPEGFEVPYDDITIRDLGRGVIELAEPLQPEPEDEGPRTVVLQPLRTLDGETLGALQPLYDEWYPPRCDPPDVSIIIRFWNGKLEWLDEAIESALTQEGVTVEVIIVDDGSDEPVIPPEDERVGVLRFPYNRGIAEGTCRGVARCRGQFIRLLDHDDRLPDGALAYQVKQLKSNRAKLCHGQIINMDKPSEPWVQTRLLAEAWDGDPKTLRETIVDAPTALIPGPAGMWRASWERPLPTPDFVTAEDQAMYRPGIDQLRDKEFLHPDQPVLIYRPAAVTSNCQGGLMPGGRNRTPITNHCVDKARRMVHYHRACAELGEPLRVAFIEPAMAIGGAQWFTAQLAVELRKRGHDPRLFVAHESELADWMRRQGVVVEQGAWSHFTDWLSMRFEAWQPHVIDNVWRVAELPTQMKYEPALHAAHAQGLVSREWVMDPAVRDSLELLVCVSDAVREDIAQEYEERAVVIPNAIDVELFRHAEHVRPAARAALGIAPDEPVVTFCGRLSADEKRVDVLYDVIRELGPAGVTFVVGGFFSEWGGREKQEAAFREVTEQHRVVFVERYMPWQAAAFHAIGDVYLSTSDSEGLSLALLEAMASAVPTVTTAAGGQSEAVVEGETGHVVPIGDVTAIGMAVMAILRMDPDKRRDMGRFGRHVCAGKFHICDSMRRHVMAYLEAIDA